MTGLRAESPTRVECNIILTSGPFESPRICIFTLACTLCLHQPNTLRSALLNSTNVFCGSCECTVLQLTHASHAIADQDAIQLHGTFQPGPVKWTFEQLQSYVPPASGKEAKCRVFMHFTCVHRFFAHDPTSVVLEPELMMTPRCLQQLMIVT